MKEIKRIIHGLVVLTLVVVIFAVGWLFESVFGTTGLIVVGVIVSAWTIGMLLE